MDKNILIMIGQILGGLGLFLLGMRLLTDGLKYAAGRALSDILAASTSTRLRGITSGAGITAVVQSSSAVTVATIGFVNAGLMDMPQALTLIYGSNIGTTMTGWLVAMLGFKFKISLFALPAIGIGMGMRIFGHEGRRGGIGDAIAGFGIFFLGIAVLKDAFAGMATGWNLAGFSGNSPFYIAIYCAMGFIMTVMMQSSSASIAIILTAAAAGIMPPRDAAAMVIGANLGTTSTAILAVIDATANARRLAAAHVLFNLVTGIVALAIMPLMLFLITDTLVLIDGGAPLTTMLAVFHTTFNIMGVLIFIPWHRQLVKFLSSRFKTEEEDEARPRYLDRTVVATPVLALHALGMELARIGAIAARMSKGAISSDSGPSLKLKSDRQIIARLIEATVDFCGRMQRTNVPEALDQQLPNAIRISGYYNDMSQLALEVAKLQRHKPAPDDPVLAEQIDHFRRMVVKNIDMTDISRDDFDLDACRQDLEKVRDTYRQIKGNLLRSASRDEIRVSQMVRLLDLLTRLRRLTEQAVKAARYLDSLKKLESGLEMESDRGTDEQEPY